MNHLPQRVSLVVETAAVLRRELRAGTWREALPGEVALARHLQVGRATVRAALVLLAREGWLAVSRGKRRRILKPPASPRRARRSGVVAVLSAAEPQALTPFRLYLISELQGPLQAAGYRLELVTSVAMGGRRATRSLEKLAAMIGADCWLLSGPPPFVQRWFLRRELPCIGVGACPDEVLIPYLRVDYAAATRHAAARLVSRGHRRAALVWSRADPRTGAEIRAAFREATRDSPVAAGRPLVLVHDGTRAGIRRLIETELARPAPPDALLVPDPRHALTALGSLMVAGARVPQDVSLLTLSHDPALDRTVPAVAHYAVDWRSFARRLVPMVLTLARTGRLPAAERLVMPELRPGETLGRRRTLSPEKRTLSAQRDY